MDLSYCSHCDERLTESQPHVCYDKASGTWSGNPRPPGFPQSEPRRAPSREIDGDTIFSITTCSNWGPNGPPSAASSRPEWV